jgi:hypothetical protein
MIQTGIHCPKSIGHSVNPRKCDLAAVDNPVHRRFKLTIARDVLKRGKPSRRFGEEITSKGAAKAHDSST